jgi:hypothetical protein
VLTVIPGQAMEVVVVDSQIMEVEGDGLAMEEEVDVVVEDVEEEVSQVMEVVVVDGQVTEEEVDVVVEDVEVVRQDVDQ